MGFLPHDVILFHILSWVPAKSVCRFMCVSKQWNSFLTSNMFKTMHNRHIDYHQNHLKLLVLSRKPSFKLSTIDCEEPPDHNGLMTPSSRLLPPFKDGRPYNICILESFHGLVCLGIVKNKNDDEYSDIILWNPLTTEYKRLSESNSQKACYSVNTRSFGLYYSSFEDDYKLLLVTDCAKVYIYSLKSDSWKYVAHMPKSIYGSWSRSTFSFNGNLYLLDKNIYRESNPITRFDTKTEEFTKIEFPSMDDYRKSYNFSSTFMVQRGRLHLCVKYDTWRSGFERTYINLWKLNTYGVFREVVTYQLMLDDIRYLEPLHLMMNRNWLMASGSRIYKVVLKKKKHSKGKGKGKGKGNDDDKYELTELYGGVRVGFPKKLRYVETFVSPNQYMK